MTRKYELLKEDYILYKGAKLYRIKALKSFGDIKKGDLGGYIQSESNLSHKGNCWVYKGGQISENCRVYGNAKISGNVIVNDWACVSGNAEIFGNIKIFGNAKISKNPIVITGFVYPVVITDNLILIGCERFTFDKLVKVDNKYVTNMSSMAGKQWAINKKFILGLAKNHQQSLKKGKSE